MINKNVLTTLLFVAPLYISLFYIGIDLFQGVWQSLFATTGLFAFVGAYRFFDFSFKETAYLSQLADLDADINEAEAALACAKEETEKAQAHAEEYRILTIQLRNELAHAKEKLQEMQDLLHQQQQSYSTLMEGYKMLKSVLPPAKMTKTALPK